MSGEQSTIPVSGEDRLTILLDDLRVELNERNQRLDRIERKLDHVLADSTGSSDNDHQPPHGRDS